MNPLVVVLWPKGIVYLELLLVQYWALLDIQFWLHKVKPWLVCMGNLKQLLLELEVKEGPCSDADVDVSAFHNLGGSFVCLRLVDSKGLFEVIKTLLKEDSVVKKSLYLFVLKVVFDLSVAL